MFVRNDDTESDPKRIKFNFQEILYFNKIFKTFPLITLFQVKTCNPPRDIENGNFSPRLEEGEGEYVHGTKVTYDCDYCHESNQELTFTCSDRSVV